MSTSSTTKSGEAFVIVVGGGIRTKGGKPQVHETAAAAETVATILRRRHDEVRVVGVVRGKVSYRGKSIQLPAVVIGKKRRAKQYDPTKNIMAAIAHLGGLSPKKIARGGTAGEWGLLPAAVKRVIYRKESGLAPDTIIEPLRGYGWMVNDDNELLAILSDPRRRSLGLDGGAPTELEELRHVNAEMYEELCRLRGEREQAVMEDEVPF